MKTEFKELSLENRVLAMLASAATSANKAGSPHANDFTRTYFEFRNKVYNK